MHHQKVHPAPGCAAVAGTIKGLCATDLCHIEKLRKKGIYSGFFSVTSLIGMLLALLAPSSAFALRPVSLLEQYPYGELTLLRIHIKGNIRAACFGTIRGDTIWVGKGYSLGTSMGTIAKINTNFVLVREAVEVNEEDFAERRLKWPIYTGENRRTGKCGTSPSTMSQIHFH